MRTPRKSIFARADLSGYARRPDGMNAATVIIATGATAQWLHLPNEARFRNHGLSACAVCDGLFFRNQEVMVVGGGDTAVEEALTLAHHASKVTIVHRRDTSAGQQNHAETSGGESENSFSVEYGVNGIRRRQLASGCRAQRCGHGQRME